MPVDELQLRKNPLGVYVDALSWTWSCRMSITNNAGAFMKTILTST